MKDRPGRQSYRPVLLLLSSRYACDEQGAGNDPPGGPAAPWDHVGQRVDFELDARGVRLVRRAEGDGAMLVAAMRGRGKGSMSTDEMMALTRGDA